MNAGVPFKEKSRYVWVLRRQPDQSWKIARMTIRAQDVRALYSEESVADYVAESVSVILPEGTLESAVCYNLPERTLEGPNPEYANALLRLAARLGLPDDYLQRIREQAA